MNSKTAKASRDYEAGRITARQFSRIMARAAISKGRKFTETKTRNDRRYK